MSITHHREWGKCLLIACKLHVTPPLIFFYISFIRWQFDERGNRDYCTLLHFGFLLLLLYNLILLALRWSFAKSPNLWVGRVNSVIARYPREETKHCRIGGLHPEPQSARETRNGNKPISIILDSATRRHFVSASKLTPAWYVRAHSPTIQYPF